MNYLKQINAFWKKADETPGFKAYHTAVYMALLQLNNDCTWKRFFDITFEQAINKCKCDKDTYYKAMEFLNQNGFFDLYNKGKNQYSMTVISLKVLYDISESKGESTGEVVSEKPDGSTPSTTPSTQNNLKHVNYKTNKPPLPGANGVAADYEFSDFWNAYKKQSGNKAEAEHLWQHLSVEDRQRIMNGLEKFTSLPENTKEQRRYQPNAVNFLNKQRWQETSYSPATVEEQAQDDLQRLCSVSYPYGLLEMTYGEFLQKIEKLDEHNKGYFKFKQFVA